MNEKAFYLTTPIYYVNDVPHIGNAYTTIISDVIARFQRLLGREVLFATGTDENAIKVAEAAQAAGLDTQTFVDRIAPEFKQVWKELKVSYDDFIRTTEPRHIKVVQEAFRRLLANGDIYKGTYEGWYCIPDETFFREAEAVDGLCPNPECRRPVEWVQEETYYFRLSAYQDRLIEWIESNPDCLQPEFRKNEVMSFIRQGLQDVSISRSAKGWGIPVPDDPDKVIYVWFDALLNYLTVAGWLSDEEKFAKTWPADVQLMGKDIFVRFHSTFWPAMLMGLGVELPKILFGHGFWSIEGEKISKSKGNAISPAKLASDLASLSGASQDVAVDAIRYFVSREVPFGVDADFSRAALIHRFNSDLANDLGNLLNRTLSMVGSYFDGVIPEPTGAPKDLASQVRSAADDAESAFKSLEISRGLEAIWRIAGAGNRFIDEQAPWKLMKEGKREEAGTVLYSVLETARVMAILISPVMPSAAAEIWRQLGGPGSLNEARWSDAMEWGGLPHGLKTTGPEPIFPRIEDKRKKEVKVEQEKTKPLEKPEQETISYDDFKKLDIRVAEIKSAERVEGADKLLRLVLDDGEGERQIVAGIALWYEPETLVGRKIVLLANLKPAKIRGVESNGMLLAASDIEGRAIILSPEQDVPAGSGVS